ncbi:MAG TPA: hypothetical protein VE008_12355 [Burkholderiales bacterium]|nr:hypothetical protein [Burkholderiales bacterium]
MPSDRIELWFWELKNEISGKWRPTRYRMTEEDARTRHDDNARKIEGTLEVRESVGFRVGNLQPDREET